MQKSLSYYLMLTKRWIWVIILGIVICGGVTFIVGKLTPPVYQASSTIIITVNASATSTDTTASIAAVPTYAQLLTNPLVLEPVLAKHPGMTLQQLTAMMTVKPQVNTQLIELDIQNHDPRLATQLVNEIGQNFERYSNAQLTASIQIWPAQAPTDPIKPKPLQDAGIGALVGLGLAVALIIVFEWIENRLHSPEEVQQVLDIEVLAVIPFLSRRKGRSKSIVVEEPGLVETYRTLCANLNAEQARYPFKLIMVASPQVGDGRSIVAANIASFLARTGKRVLLVDADLHRPVQAQQFQLNNHNGLSTFFLDPSACARSVLNGQETSIPTLRVLTAGVLPPNPAELLQSLLAKQLFRYYVEEAPFDYIVFDTPPLLALADAQILASLVHATILVADLDKTPRRALLQAKRILKRANSQVVGVVINKCRWPEYSKPASSHYYSYNVKQPEVDTSLVMYSGTSFPDERLPNTPPPSLIADSP